MIRSFLSSLLAVAALAAAAQTAPRPAHKATAHKPAAHQSAAKPVPAATTDATSTAPDGGFGNGAPGASPANADGKGQGAYAAPGMAVDVTPGKEVGSYKGTADKATPAKRTSSSGTTLTPK